MNAIRAKAGAILSARKMRELEAEGVTVVTQSRLDALERLYDAVRNWRYGLIDKQTNGDVGSIACAYPAIYRLATTFDEMETMDQ